jgi:hypothetical protein
MASRRDPEFSVIQGPPSSAGCAGRWWPEVDRLLDGIDRIVPDRV